MRGAQKELASLSKTIRDRLVEKIRALAVTPRPPGCIALLGARWKGCTRIRSGDFRIIYRIEEDRLIVLVVKIGDRKDIYERI